MICRESWYLEAQGEKRLRELEEKMRHGDVDALREYYAIQSRLGKDTEYPDFPDAPAETILAGDPPILIGYQDIFSTHLDLKSAKKLTDRETRRLQEADPYWGSDPTDQMDLEGIEFVGGGYLGENMQRVSTGWDFLYMAAESMADLEETMFELRVAEALKRVRNYEFLSSKAKIQDAFRYDVRISNIQSYLDSMGESGRGNRFRGLQAIESHEVFVGYDQGLKNLQIWTRWVKELKDQG